MPPQNEVRSGEIVVVFACSRIVIISVRLETVRDGGEP